MADMSVKSYNTPDLRHDGSGEKKGNRKRALWNALETMQELGWAYAVIGWPAKSAAGFYQNCVCAVLTDEEPSGVYKRMMEVDEWVLI